MPRLPTCTYGHYGYTLAVPAGWTGTQATRQWDGRGAPGDKDSDVESLAHNIQIGAPRCQIRQGSPKRQNGGSGIETQVTVGNVTVAPAA